MGEKVFWFLLGGILVLIFLFQKQYRWNLLTISILGFIAGWRGIHISAGVTIYPTEFFIWLGFLIYLLGRTSRLGGVNQPKPSFFEVAVALLALIGGITALIYAHPLSEILDPLKSFIVFIPMLVLFRSWIRNKQQIVFFARMLVYAGTIISILGLMERYIPAISALFPNFSASPIETRYNFGFDSYVNLAAFSFWGTPVVSTLLVLFTGLAVFVPKPNIRWQKIIWFLTAPLLTLAIISTGYRSAWLGLILVLILGVVFNPWQILPWLVLVIPASFVLFSSAFLDRLKTVLSIPALLDPTFETRYSAMQNGLQTIKLNFIFGIGWGSPTTFNDWVNIGVALGLIGLLAFAIWYGLLLINLLKFVRKTHGRDNFLICMSFFTPLAGYSLVMLSGAMSQVFPIMTGFWFVFCLGWRLVEILKEEEFINGKAVSLATDLQ